MIHLPVYGLLWLRNSREENNGVEIFSLKGKIGILGGQQKAREIDSSSYGSREIIEEGIRH